MNNIISIQKKIHQVTPDLIGDLESYIDYLIQKSKKIPKRKLKQDWAGAIKQYSKQYGSVELQKKSLEWRDH